MGKFAIYTSFVAAGILDSVMFFTTTNYVQLVGSIIFYLILTVLAFKLFPRKTPAESPIGNNNAPTNQNSVATAQTLSNNISEHQTITNQTITKDVEVLDIDKRAFLKIIGATGIAFLTTDSIFFSSFQKGKKIESSVSFFILRLYSTLKLQQTKTFWQKHKPSHNY